MKNNLQPEFYFSAYPLSVIGGTSQSQLKISKMPGGVSLKVLPTQESEGKKNKQQENQINIDAIQNFEVDWFNNYE